MQATVTRITPAMARDLLGKQGLNRSVRQNRVQQFAASMKAGAWALNGEPIILDDDDQVIDGAHRLTACILADAPFKTLVVKGVPDSCRDTIDTGAARTPGDMLTIRGFKNANALAALVNLVFMYDRTGKIEVALRSSYRAATHTEILETLHAHGGELERVVATALSFRKASRMLVPRVSALLLLLFSKKDGAAALEFFADLDSGENLSANDPVLMLREKLSAALMLGYEKKLPASVRAIMAINAWNARRENRTLQILKVSSRRGANEVSFPEIR